jgi:hypothetical protein
MKAAITANAQNLVSTKTVVQQEGAKMFSRRHRAVSQCHKVLKEVKRQAGSTLPETFGE